MGELRCDNTMHGVIHDGILEVKCRNPRCGVKPGVVVLHQFDIKTEMMINTERYRDPVREEVNKSAANSHSSPLRAEGL